MITGAQSADGLGEQVAARLAPWRDLAESAVRQVLAASPAATLLPAQEVAHGIVAGFLGLELLADLDGDQSAALALFDRALLLAGLLDLTGGLGLLPAASAPGRPGRADPHPGHDGSSS